MYFDGIQTILRHDRTGLSLEKFGNPGLRTREPCENWYIPPQEWVTKVEWTYGRGGVSSIMIKTNSGALLTAGKKRVKDSEVFYEFDDEKPFVGFMGYNDIKAVTKEGDEVIEI